MCVPCTFPRPNSSLSFYAYLLLHFCVGKPVTSDFKHATAPLNCIWSGHFGEAYCGLIYSRGGSLLYFTQNGFSCDGRKGRESFCLLTDLRKVNT